MTDETSRDEGAEGIEQGRVEGPLDQGPQKAYSNAEFLQTPAARPLRIMAEYVEPKARFERYNIQDTIVFFGSARIKPRDEAEAALAKIKAEGGNVAEAERQVELSDYYEKTRELAAKLTDWSKSLGEKGRRFVVCSGGGPGIMEAANRGASEAKGINVGLGISLPFEQHDNAYITRELSFQFHYFFMRKFWFTYLAKAVIIMPGGFGTMDELFELLTLVQTSKVRKRLPMVLFGSQFWSDVVDFEALERYGTISPEDLQLFFRTDSVEEAFDFLTEQLLTGAMVQPGLRL